MSKPDTRTLDPHSRELLQRLAERAAAIAPEDLTLERRRLLSRESDSVFLPAEGAVQSDHQDVQIELPGRSLRARHYRPVAGGSAADVLLVYFHGGGWVAGDLETHHNACAFLGRHTGCGILSVEYRKSPEHRFPAPCDDALEAYLWAAQQIGSWRYGRIAVAGDSAGAHLAAHAMFAAPQVATAAALLFYPVADMNFTNASYLRSSSGPGLTSSGMRWFWQQFLGSEQPSKDARAILMRQQWQRKPPATVLSIAWHDPLHDEGVAYAELLQAAGSNIMLHLAEDMAHGFLRQCSINNSARRHVEQAANSFLELLAIP